MKMRRLALVGTVACGALCGMPAYAADTMQQPKVAIPDSVSTSLLQMGHTLLGKQFSFRAETIRVYQDKDGPPLHIFHTINVTVRRPDRLAVHVDGDDGKRDLYYDGKYVNLFASGKNQYSTIAAPGSIEAMMHDVMGKRGVDFPLADFLTNAPNKAFLTGVTTGVDVGTAMIDGVPYRHLFFTQPPGIELELWVSNDNRSLPKRLIVTYRSLPAQPSFIATFSDWNFTIRPADSEFVFLPPPGSSQVELKSASLERSQP